MGNGRTRVGNCLSRVEHDLHCSHKRLVTEITDEEETSSKSFTDSEEAPTEV